MSVIDIFPLFCVFTCIFLLFLFFISSSLLSDIVLQIGVFSWLKSAPQLEGVILESIHQHVIKQVVVALGEEVVIVNKFTQ